MYRCKQEAGIANSFEVSFGVATAAVGFAAGFRTQLDGIALTFYVLCGLTRLARFNVTVALLPKDKTGKSKYFEGVPIPSGCLSIASIIAFWVYSGWVLEDIPLGLYAPNTIFEFHPAVLIYVVNGCLMISKTLHIPKP